jgi:tetratricopeptide (TPR) repeat protein
MNIRRAVLTLVAGVLVSVLVANAAPTGKNPMDIYIARARTQDAQGRHDLAAANWKQVLLLTPGQPEALMALARYYKETGDTAKAKIYADHLRTVNPGAQNLQPVISSSDQLKALEEAARLSAAHRYTEAINLYRRVLGTNPTTGDWAVAYYQTEAAIPSELPHAIQHLRSIVQDYPANPGYRLTLAKILTYGSQTRPGGLRMLQDFHGSAEEMEQAREAWRAALLWSPSSAAAQETGAEYLRRFPDQELAAKLRAGAEEHVRTVPEGDPEEAEAYRSLQKGEDAAAIKQFTDMLNHSGQRGRAHLGLGYVYMKQKNFTDAVQAFDAARNEGVRTPALERIYHDARYWERMQLGNKAADAGDSVTAANEFNQAAQFDSSRPEANEALAGLWLKDEQPDKALPVLRNLIQTHKDRDQAWIALVNAEVQAGQFSDVLAQRKSIPAEVSARLNHNPDYLSALAVSQLSLGYDAEAQQTLKTLDAQPAADDASHARNNLKIASLLLRLGRVEEAEKLCRAAVRRDRANPEAWQTLIRAEYQAGRTGTALQIIENLPAEVKAKLTSDPGYLIQAAAIYQKEHQFDGAAVMLANAQQVAGQNLQSSIPLQLQLASLDREMGRTRQAYQIYRQLTLSAPDRTEPWIGILGTLHDGKQDAKALTAAERIPAQLRFRLRNDVGYLQAMASIYSGVGDNARAMEYLGRVTGHYRAQGVPAPFAVNLQSAWLQLNAGNERGLSFSLDALSKTTNLTLKEKKQVEELWVAWSIRRAEATVKFGSADQALALLQAAQQVYPYNSDLRHEIGTIYIRRGQPENAYKLYARFDWAGASQADFAGGISAAAAADHWKEAEMWLHMALNQYPGNRDLLRQAAQVEQDHGNLKKAEAYWSSLRAMDTPAMGTGIQPLTMDSASAGYGQTASQHLAAMLMPAQGPADTLQRRTMENDADSESIDALLAGTSNIDTDARPQPMENQQASFPMFHSADRMDPAFPENDRSSTLVLSQASARTSVSMPDTDQMARQLKAESQRDPATSLSSEPTGFDRPASEPFSSSAYGAADEQDNATAAAPVNMASNLRPLPNRYYAQPGMTLGLVRPVVQRDGLAELQAQLSPWAGGGASATTRSGQSGFDQLTRVESTMETSTVVGQSARVSVLMQPVMLEGGEAGSKPLYSFGTKGTAPSGSQNQSGLGGEVQIATSHVQASLGYTPSSFLVQNTLGSLSISPTRSFSFHFSRTPVKDTMLSYAGVKDPSTGSVWGGVVATGGGVQVSHGDAQSGFYGLMDYASLSGRNVTGNTRFTGSLGGYWRAYQNEFGTLTAGVNMTGMHYDKNLQYFTYGQGGYFSPDAYMLINAPITWRSNITRNFSYIVTGSIGTQSYQQGSIVAGSFLSTVNTSQTSSANYGLNALGSYQLTPNWYLEANLNANNTYDYQQRTAGFSLRYMTHPHPVADSSSPTGLLNPEQIRPLLIP